MQNLSALLNKWEKLVPISTLAFFCLCSLTAPAQVQSVTTMQHLSFGTFSQGSSGGTVTISDDGTKSTTGTVVSLLMGSPSQPAIFEVEAPEGTIISILNGPDVTLRGSSGGTMQLHLAISDHGSSFVSSVAPPGRTSISIGGELTVGDPLSSPPGTYSGSFSITFNNE